MKLTFFLLMIFGFLISCSADSSHRNQVILLAEEGLNQSCRKLEQNIEKLVMTSQERKNNAVFLEKWIKWDKIIRSINNELIDINYRIIKLRDALRKKGADSRLSIAQAKEFDSLQLNMIAFKNAVLATDLIVRSEMENQFILFSDSLDHHLREHAISEKLSLWKVSVSEALLLLSRLQYNVHQSAYNSILACFDQIVDDRPTFCTAPQAIFGQSHQVVAPNGEISVTVAVADLKIFGKQEVTIDGTMITANRNYTFTKTIKASSIPGEHSIPVMITYVDQDGKEVRTERRLEYKVEKCPD